MLSICLFNINRSQEVRKKFTVFNVQNSKQKKLRVLYGLGKLL